MKKYLKILVLILILSASRIKGVMAESFYEDNWISGIYANLVDGNFSKPQLMRFIRKKSNNEAVYCITPRVLLYEDENYNITEEINLTIDQQNRIERLAYFGYGYQNHTDDKWYAITQFMIWQTVEPNMDVFFTDTRAGNRIIRFTDEMNELNSLVDNAYNAPYLPSMNLAPNSTYSVVDTNNALGDYELEDIDGIDINIDNNVLNINTKEKGYYNLRFNKVYNKYPTTTFYYKANKGQTIMAPGNISSITYQVDVNVISAKISLIKQDMYTGKKLPNAIYELYDDNYTLLGSVTTDENGEAEFDNLLYGHYYLLEHQAPDGYNIDETYHEIDVDDDIEYITFSDEPIKREEPIEPDNPEKPINPKEKKDNNNKSKENNNESNDLKDNRTINNIENPKTSDTKIYIYIIFGYLSFIILLYIFASIKNKKKQ